MVKREAPDYTGYPPRVPFHEEQARQHSEDISRQVHSQMTPEQFYRADHPAATPYDMGPVPMITTPAPALATQDEIALDKANRIAKKRDTDTAKLKKEIDREIDARKKLIKSTLVVKKRYNIGNDKLASLSKEYTNPETPVERKKELSDEFNATQKWMTSDKNLYNSMRDQSEAAKRRIEARNMELNQLKYVSLG